MWILATYLFGLFATLAKSSPAGSPVAHRRSHEAMNHFKPEAQKRSLNMEALPGGEPLERGQRLGTRFFFMILVYKILSLDFLQNLRTN